MKIRQFLAAVFAALAMLFAGDGVAQVQATPDFTQTMVAKNGTTVVTVTQEPCTSDLAKAFLSMSNLDPSTAKAASVLYNDKVYPGCWVLHLEPEPHVDVALEVQPRLLTIDIEDFSPK